MNNHIGVVLATYNGAKYVEEQLISIINQSVRPDLIIVSDGGSQDETISICRKVLLNTDIENIILTSDVQLSVKDNFEKGLMHCKTDYIFFSDQDDVWLLNKIEDFMDIFRKENADLIFCNSYIVDSNLQKKDNTLWETIGYYVQDNITVYDKWDVDFLRELLKHNVVTGMCMAISGRCINQILPFSEYGIHDVWVAHSMNCIGKIVALNKCEALYRQHDSNVVGTNNSIQKTLSRRTGYYNRIKNRLSFFEDIIERYECDEKIKEIYLSYIIHIENRIAFIGKKIPLYKLFSLRENYKQYEYKWKQILVKDIYTRFVTRKENIK